LVLSQKGALRACGQETGAVGAGCRAFFPADRVTVFVGSAAAILAVFCAYAVAVLSDLAGDPVFFRERANHVADKLGLADAASVSTDDD
jgi:hypothetical protein